MVLNWFRLYLLFDSCYCKVHATYCVSFYKFITGCNCTESDFWMFWVTNKSERKKYLGTNFVILLTIFVKILRSTFRSSRYLFVFVRMPCPPTKVDCRDNQPPKEASARFDGEANRVEARKSVDGFVNNHIRGCRFAGRAGLGGRCMKLR